MSPAGTLRAELLTSGSVKAIIRLPGGLVPYRPGYEVALWVLNIDYRTPLRGRVLLADVSDRELTPTVIDALTTDVTHLAAGGLRPQRAQPGVRGHDAGCHPGEVAAPTHPPLPADRARAPAHSPNASPAPWSWNACSGTYGRSARCCTATSPSGPTRCRRRTATIAELIYDGRARTNRLSLRKGTRVAADLISPTTVTILPHTGCSARRGARTAAGRSRRIDRVAYESTYPNAQRSLPGDVVITTAPEPAALVDHEGYSVMEFPARILRITERGTEHFTPRVLAALLTASSRAEHAIRPVQRLEELRLPLLSPPSWRTSTGY